MQAFDNDETAARDARTEVGHARAARTQSANRTANEDTHARRDAAPLTEYGCECTQKTCTATVWITDEEWAEARAAVPTCFVVAVGHARSDAERIVKETDRYQLVEKTGDAAQLARKLRPRDPTPET